MKEISQRSSWLFFVALISHSICFPARAATPIHISSNSFVYYNSWSPETGQGAISVYSTKSGQVSTFLPLPTGLIGYINFASFDPTGQKLALVQGLRNLYTKQPEKEFSPRTKLTILNLSDKKPIITFSHGTGLFAFSPNGDRIIFSEQYPSIYDGPPAPPGYLGYLWIYDFQSQIKKKLPPPPLPCSVSALNWAEFDGNIYVEIGRAHV